MRDADTHADPGVAFKLPLLDLLDGISAHLDVGIRIEDAGKKLQRAIFTGIGQFEEPAILEGGEDAAHDLIKPEAAGEPHFDRVRQDAVGEEKTRHPEEEDRRQRREAKEMGHGRKRQPTAYRHDE